MGPPEIGVPVRDESDQLLQGETLYVRFGDWFAWVVTSFALVVLMLKLAARRKGTL